MEKSRRRFLKQGTTAGVLGALPHRFSLASQRPGELAAGIDGALFQLTQIPLALNQPLS